MMFIMSQSVLGFFSHPNGLYLKETVHYNKKNQSGKYINYE